MGNNPGNTNQSSTVQQEGTKLNPGDQAQPGTPGAAENVCPDCKGSGKVGAQPCQTCGGTGKVITEVGGA